MKVQKDGRTYNVTGVQLQAFLAAGYEKVQEKAPKAPKKTGEGKEAKAGAGQ